jgi:hypothetical protein
MPKAYVIARANVTNAAAWADYAAKATEAIKQYGGNPIVRGGRVEVAEGEGPVPMRIRSNMPLHASCGRARARSTSWLWKEHLEACIAESATGNANPRIAVHSAAQSRKALTMRAPCFRHRGRSLSPPAGPSFSPLRERRPFLVGGCHPGSSLRPGPG